MFGGIRKNNKINHWYFVKNCGHYLCRGDPSFLLREASTSKEPRYSRGFLREKTYIRHHEDAKIIVPPEFI
jgi:hypothetical protein